jgi:predicted NBD/HSP70 family sugar kinase
VTLKACTVVVRDFSQTTHAIDVTAETLFEAVAQALAALGTNDWVDEIGKGLTTVTVTVRNPEVTHTIRIKDFEDWLMRSVNSPAETILKMRLRHLLGLDKR